MADSFMIAGSVQNRSDMAAFRTEAAIMTVVLDLRHQGGRRVEGGDERVGRAADPGQQAVRAGREVRRGVR
jgi:hypothetical protein